MQRFIETLTDSPPQVHAGGAADPSPHTVIDGRYRVIERLGAGTMGVVFRVEDVGLGRAMALKIIAPAYATDGATIERFKAEARVLAEHRHDNVVQVHAFGPHPPSFYLAMEFVAGKNLDELIEGHSARNECVALDRAVMILRQVASGLAAVHEKGIVHRDVKPSNVVIEDGTGRPVLIDFGLARHVDGGDGPPRAPRRMTSVKHSCVGTPAYAAPEQVRAGRDELTCRADIYSLGCTAFELLTGRLPFIEADPFVMVRAHAIERPPLLSSVRPELTALDDVIARALQKDARDRYASCTAFIADVDGALQRLRAAQGQRAHVARIVVLERDEGVRRRLGVMIERASSMLDIATTVVGVASQAELTSVIEEALATVIVIDEESVCRVHGAAHTHADFVGAFVDEVIARARARGDAVEVVVLQRDFAERPTRFARDGMRAVPKPVSARIVEALLAKLLTSDRESRSRQDDAAPGGGAAPALR